MTSAWYILPSNNILARHINAWHLPYSAWMLSYLVLGAAIAPSVSYALLGWTLAAFFFGFVVAAHHVDLLNQDPLGQNIPHWQSWTLAFIGLVAGGLIGAWQAAIGNMNEWLFLVVPLGAVVALGYGLEWPGFHVEGVSFPLYWAVGPLVLSALAQDFAFHPALVPAIGFAYLTALAQRVLSTRVRFIRRRVDAVDLSLHLKTGETSVVQDKSWFLFPDEWALALLSFALPCVSVCALLLRF